MRNIIVESLMQTPLEKQRIEIVERKGLGHPDYICDAVMDQVSIDLSNEYLERTGSVLHHNVDKSLLVAGESQVAFGGGHIRQPMLFIFGDRATSKFDDQTIDVEHVAVTAAKKWFKRNLRFVDPVVHLNYQSELKPGSPGLVDIFRRKGRVLGANDTSAAVGYAPLTRTEKTVLDVEMYMNSRTFKDHFPESGEDIKVMGFRNGNALILTVAMAFVDRYISSEEDYFERKNRVLEEIQKRVSLNTSFETIEVQLNTLDKPGRGVGGLYLTVLGTSAESGDSGQVGRGNRANGLISLNRPFCSEAAAGKNPVSHVGKIYNFLTFRLAERILKEELDLQEVYVWLLSRIGNPIDHPAVAAVQVIMKDADNLTLARKRVHDVLDYELEHIDQFSSDLVQGKVRQP